MKRISAAEKASEDPYCQTDSRNEALASTLKTSIELDSLKGEDSFLEPPRRQRKLSSIVFTVDCKPRIEAPKLPQSPK